MPDNTAEVPKRKRVRSANCTVKEKNYLLKLCNEHSSIIECKVTDGPRNAQKKEAWDEIEKKFNASGKGPYRKKKSLQEKYENIKKDMRKVLAEERAYASGTGGGPYMPPTKFTEEERKLYETIKLSCDGLPNAYGSDTSRHRQKFNHEYTTNTDEEDDVDAVVLHWNSPSTAMLQTAKNPALVVDDDIESVTEENSVVTISVENCSEAPVVVPSTSAGPATGRASNAATLTVKPIIPKKRTGHKCVKSKPFEELAKKKMLLIEAELDLVELKKQQMIEEHEMKMRSYHF